MSSIRTRTDNNNNNNTSNDGSPEVHDQHHPQHGGNVVTTKSIRFHPDVVKYPNYHYHKRSSMSTVVTMASSMDSSYEDDEEDNNSSSSSSSSSSCSIMNEDELMPLTPVKSSKGKSLDASVLFHNSVTDVTLSSTLFDDDDDEAEEEAVKEIAYVRKLEDEGSVSEEEEEEEEETETNSQDEDDYDDDDDDDDSYSGSSFSSECSSFDTDEDYEDLLNGMLPIQITSKSQFQHQHQHQHQHQPLPPQAPAPPAPRPSMVDSKQFLQSICGELQHVGRQLLVDHQDMIRQRAKVLASIHFLSSHLPNCVLDQLGNEVKQEQNRQHSGSRRRQELPYTQKYQCALLFVDISGFTKLATLMDPENLSKVINHYFQLLVDKVEEYNGDIQKYAGDAIFVEWRVTNDLTLQQCVAAAAACAASMVQEYSDYQVNQFLLETFVSNDNDHDDDNDDTTTTATTTTLASNSDNHHHNNNTLNIHCGLGVGNMTSIHVGNNTQRREYLYFGKPIAQATNACDVAQPGQAAASPQAMKLLLSSLQEQEESVVNKQAIVFATKTSSMILDSNKNGHHHQHLQHIYNSKKANNNKSRGITTQVDGLELQALKQYRTLISLYVHPVVVMNDVAARGNFAGSSATSSLSMSSSSSSSTSTSSRSGTLQEQRREDAELRNVYVLFIKPMVPQIIQKFNQVSDIHEDDNSNNNDDDNDDDNDDSVSASDVHLLNDIMNVTLQELDTHKGHLRQYIVDDKGLVLIATFGLRGSTFPNMVSERALPATIALRQSLLSKLGVDCRIGATFGDVYCGNVGGEQRQEFAVMGPSVNLAARLMCSPSNSGILVDSAIRNVASKVYHFTDLDPVPAKGYSEPVCIYEPMTCVVNSSTNTNSKENCERKEGNNDDEEEEEETSKHEIILYRIDTLELTVRAALNVGAVLGDTFALNEVASVLQENQENTAESRMQVLESLEHAVQEGILSVQYEKEGNIIKSKDGNAVFTFESPLWRSALLNLMLAARKRDVHRKIALNLEANNQSEDVSVAMGKKIAVHWMAAGNATKTTAVVLSVGKQIEDMDAMNQESLQMYQDALKLWGWKQNCASRIGGFPPNVLQVFREDQLQDIFSLMVARGRWYSNAGDYRNSIEAYTNVLQIKDSGLVKEVLSDVSVTFPAYDGIINAMSKNQSCQDAKYEQKLIDDFVEATSSCGKIVHHLHALRLKTNLLHRFAQFDKASLVQKKMREVYKPEIHYKRLQKFYGEDFSVLNYAL